MNKIFKKIKPKDLQFEVSNHTGWISVSYANKIIKIQPHSLAWKLERLLDKMFLIKTDEKINKDVMINRLLSDKNNWTITTKELTDDEIKINCKNIWATFNKGEELLKLLNNITFDKDVFIK